MRYALHTLAALAIGAAAILPRSSLPAQQPPVSVTTEDYARAESFLAGATSGLVFGATVQPDWLSGDRFWYRNSIPDGFEFILADVAAGTRSRAFDHERLAAAIGAVTGDAIEPLALPFRTIDLSPEADRLSAQAGEVRLQCDLAAYTCEPAGPGPDRDPNAIPSPDGTKAAFIRDHNLWLRDVDTGAESALTADGTLDFGYATNNAGWVKRDSPVLLWSPAPT